MHCLIIGKVWPEPNSTAAGRRTVDLIRSLRIAGYRVSFASAAQPTRYSLDPDALGVASYSVKPNDAAFDQWIVKLAPDSVLFDRFMIEEQFGWRVEKACPQALRILDTSDLHCLREARRVRLENGSALNLYNEVALREIAAIHRSDLTLIISEYEFEVLLKEFAIPRRQIAYLPFWLESLDDKLPTFENRRHFMIVGNFMHPPNVDAVRWCKQAIWPRIRKKLPQTELHCYGAYGSNYQAELHAPEDGFIYKGRVVDIHTAMRNYRINCVPLRYGAGLKGKVFDGFQTGTPTVTTAIGAEGIIGSEDWGYSISDNPVEFAENAIELYTNAEIWANVQACGQRLVQKRFSAGKWLAKLPQLVETAFAHMSENRKCHFTGRMLRHHQHRSAEFMSRWIEAKNRNLLK